MQDWGQVKWCLYVRSGTSRGPRGPESELTLIFQVTSSNLDDVIRRPQTRNWRADGGPLGSVAEVGCCSSETR